MEAVKTRQSIVLRPSPIDGEGLDKVFGKDGYLWNVLNVCTFFQWFLLQYFREFSNFEGKKNGCLYERWRRMDRIHAKVLAKWQILVIWLSRSVIRRLIGSIWVRSLRGANSPILVRMLLRMFMDAHCSLQLLAAY